MAPMGVGGFGAMRALSTRNDEPQRASRPFDKDRDGFVIGEGSGVVILETLEFAQARGYQISSDVRGKRLDGRQAQSCAFQASGLEIRIQVVAAGQCIYTLMVMWRGPPPDADRFLDGFRVKKDCAAEERARAPERADGG